jgi:ribosomal protein L37AE/L43A
MTEEQAILERSKDRVAEIMGNERQADTEIEVKSHISQACSSCGARIVRTGRNRLSDCGHMRMSGGGWVPREERPKPEVEKTTPCAVLTKEQRRELDSRVGGMIRAYQAMEKATAESDRAQAYYEAYLDELAGGFRG